MPELEDVPRYARRRLNVLHWPLAPAMVMILVACSTASPQAAVAVGEIDVRAMSDGDPVVVLPDAPTLNPAPDELCLWPSGAPDEVVRDYHCDTEASPRPRDIILSPGRWDELKLHLDRWNEYPWKAAGAVDDCHRGWRDRIAHLARIETARQIKHRLEEGDAAWPLGSYLAIVGGSALGVALGIVIGVLAGL
jgi:hypothetical protein